MRVLVVLVRWQGGDASYLRAPVQDAMWRDVAAFWKRETYGRQALDITITPLLDSSKPMPGCNHGAVIAEASTLSRAAGFTTPYDRLVVLSTEGCGIQWITLGTTMLGYSFVSYSGKAAHEMGHSFGLEHSRSGVTAENLYGIYGNAWEVMSGIWIDLATWHFNAFDKWKLGVLSPLPCADATLRPIEDHPDAIRCGTLWAELHQDRNVWVFKEETTPSNTYGPSDNTRVAILKPGERFGAIANAGGGQVTARAP